MASIMALLLVAGLVVVIVAGAFVLSPSSGQTVTDSTSQATDNLEEELPLQDIEISADQEVGAITSTSDLDTDGDGIDDDDEVKRGTDPTNANTDGDRYRDNEDSRPLSINSAEVRITVSDREVQENYGALEAGMLDQEALATVTVDMIINNDGNDYASFVKFDGVFMMDGVQLKRVTNDIGRINAEESIGKQITFTLRVIDIPQDAMSEITKQLHENITPVISFEIENLAYEKF
jgi:hypothetical protein